MRQINPPGSKAAIKAAVRECKEYQSIDPPPVQWTKGQLNVSKVDALKIFRFMKSPLPILLRIRSIRKWYNWAMLSQHQENFCQEAVFCNMIYRYKIRLRGTNGTHSTEWVRNKSIQTGRDYVWAKLPHNRFTTRYRVGPITGISSSLTMLVDGMLRHIKDLRSYRGSDISAVSAQEG